MKQRLGLESEPCTGEWNRLTVMDGFTLDRKIHAAGWNFFFLAADVKVMFFGALGAAKIQDAVSRILAKVKPLHFNGLEITEIVARRFLGVALRNGHRAFPAYATECNLDSHESRQTSQNDAAWAKG